MVRIGSGALGCAVMESGGKPDSLVKRFAGEGSNPPRDYKQWKRWARAYLKVQASRGMKEDAFGSVLYTLLDGAALRAFDAVDMNDIEQDGGQDVVFQVLDERYPEEASHDRLGEVLDAIFDLRIEKNETTATFTGKVKSAFSAAEAEGIRFPSVARGYMVLRFARLSAEKKAVVLAASRRSYEEADVMAALRTTYPDGLYQGRSSVNFAENGETEDYVESDEMVMLAGELAGEDDQEPLEEQDAVEVLLSWKQTRANITKEKLARGFPSRQDMRKLESRVRCFKCKQVGHFSKNCPKKGSGGSDARSSKSSGGDSRSSKVNYVNMVRDDDGWEFLEEITEVMQSWDQKQRDYWRQEGDMVIREHVVPRQTMFSPFRTQCPVPLEELLTARTTRIQKGHQSEERFTPNWKHHGECHRDLGFEWTGQTVFYRLKKQHEEMDLEEEDIQDEVDGVCYTFMQHQAEGSSRSLAHITVNPCYHQSTWMDPDDPEDTEILKASDEAELMKFSGTEEEYQKIIEDGEKASEEIQKMIAERKNSEAATTKETEEPHQAYQAESESADEDEENHIYIYLVHQAGRGVVDTGCGRGLVGSETLEKHKKKLAEIGETITELPNQKHVFRYGNGSRDEAVGRVEVPVFIQGKRMTMRLHVVPGQVPLLISKKFLKSLGAKIDLEDSTLVLKRAGLVARMFEPKDNSYQINLCDWRGHEKETVETEEVDFTAGNYVCMVNPENREGATGEVVDEDELDYADSGTWGVMKARERKKLMKDINDALVHHGGKEQPTVMEVFCPGRFAEQAKDLGYKEVWSMDLSNGWDWANLHHREVAEKMVETRKPDLLILCPPCGPLSALQNLTPPEKRKNPEGYEREVLEAKSMVRWCFKMAEKQIQGGRHYLFESSKTSKAWSIPTVERFMEKYHPVIVEVSLCALGVRCPETQKLYGKAWRFVTSSRGIGLQLAPYHCDHQHEHQPVEGSSGGQMRSIQTQQYPKKLIRSILVGYHREEACDMCWAVSDGVPNEKDDPELRSESKRKIDQAIRKMHVNLGHASTKDMVRILRHAGAQEAVLQRVREFRCPLCEARKEPKIPRASAVPKDVAPLRYIGLDVKHLPGFKRHERIKALNIVDRVSGLQQMTPFRETESSEVLRRLYRQSWTKPYGRPKWLKFDASRCNLGQHFLDAIERDGTTVLDIPGEAHEQIGDVEVHGKHFESALNRVLDHMQPQNYDEWVECVDCLVEAKNSLMRRGGHSPYQLVLGRDPEFPGDDILCPKDGTDPITNSTILIDEVAERVHKTRLAARHSVIQEMDQQAARIALNSRPRPTREFTPGDEVAVWRRGRGIPGKMSHARWRGPGIVAGTSGNNYWVSMPGSFIKCSAEQLRYRTEEEGEADKFLVRDLRAAAVNLYPEVGGENRRQKNFLDITAEDYPPGAGPRPPSIPHEIPQNNENRADPRDDHSSRASTSGISKKKSSEIETEKGHHEDVEQLLLEIRISLDPCLHERKSYSR